MIMRALALMAGLYGVIGPGLILAALLPLSALVLTLVLREALRRAKSGPTAA